MKKVYEKWKCLIKLIEVMHTLDLILYILKNKLMKNSRSSFSLLMLIKHPFAIIFCIVKFEFLLGPFLDLF